MTIAYTHYRRASLILEVLLAYPAAVTLFVALASWGLIGAVLYEVL